MALEQRGSGRYYYRKVWRNGTCVSEYMGRGAYAYLAEWEAEADRNQRNQQQREFAVLQAKLHRAEQAVEAYHQAVRRLVATVLRGAGFYQHKGQWRLKRQKERAAMADAVVKQMTRNEVEEQYFALMKAAKGKQKGKALEQFRAYARAHPHMFDDFNMLRNTTLDAVLSFCTNDEVTQIHLRGEAHALRRRLGGTEPTLLEQLLIDDIVHCWLRLCAMEQIYSGNLAKGQTLSIATVMYLERRLSVAQGRYVKAIESLARVRGLLARVGVQINIAQQQVVQNSG